ncbi:MAG: hypothetical protein ABIK67_04535 [candidate division WOR-3 bacterium]
MGFSAIVNQDSAKAQLIADLKARHFPAYLFVGPRGVGKRTTALTLAKALCCENRAFDSCDECRRCKAIENLNYPDLRVIFPVAPGSGEEENGEGARIAELQKEYAYDKIRPETPNNGTISIGRIRELKYEMGLPPYGGKRRVVIILDADRLTNEAANSFLKTLEEPQAQTSFILITERSSALPATIRSRCQIVRFFSIPAQTIAHFLKTRYKIPESLATIAAEVAEGSVRRALEYLKDPEQFLPEAIKDWFRQPERTKLNLAQISLTLKELPVNQLINALIFIYRQAIFAKLGIKTHYTEICQKLVDPFGKIDLSIMLAKIEYLLKALADAELYLNKRLFIHSVLVKSLAEEKKTIC